MTDNWLIVAYPGVEFRMLALPIHLILSVLIGRMYENDDLISSCFNNSVLSSYGKYCPVHICL